MTEMPQKHKKSGSASARNMVFFVIMCMATVAMCIFYLNLKSDLSEQMQNVVNLQSELNDVTEANNTRYNHIHDSVSLDEIRDRAINELGMTYVDPSQIITYENQGTDYLEQNQEIPRE